MPSSHLSLSSCKNEAPEPVVSRNAGTHASLPSKVYSAFSALPNFQKASKNDPTGIIDPNSGNAEHAPNRFLEALAPPGPQHKTSRPILNRSEKFTRKTSQRPTLSRKIKCNKTVPCAPCSERGRQEVCCQQPWIPPSKFPARQSVHNIEDELLIRTLDGLKHEVSYLREQLKDIDALRYRLQGLEELICNTDCDGKKLKQRASLPTSSSQYDIGSQRQGASPCAASGLEITDTTKTQEDPSDFKVPSPMASAMTSVISKQTRTGLIENRDTSKDAATTFEFLALGADHQATEGPNPHRGSTSASFASAKNCSANFNAALNTEKYHKDALLTLIPPNALSKLKSTGLTLTKRQSDSIIDFALDTLGWQHPVIHFSTFRAQANKYWSNIQASREAERNGGNENIVIVNQAWFSLYISLLSVGVHHMSPLNAAKCELGEDDLKTMPGLWFNDCIAALNRFNYLENPSMEVLQTITVLGCSGYDIAPPTVLYVLHACANRMAQTLGIDRISADPPGPPANFHHPGKMAGYMASTRKWSAIELMEREVGKRVWWALVTRDWFWVPYHQSWSISPGHFSTPIPSNWPDDEFPQMNFSGQPMQDNGISMVMQQIILGQVAVVIQRFFSRLIDAPSELHEDTLINADQEIQRIVAGLPPSLKEVPDYISPEEKKKLPSYVPQLRHFLQISCAHKRLVIHRAFLNHITSVKCSKSEFEQGKASETQLNQKTRRSSPCTADADITHLNSELSPRRCKATHANLNRRSAVESKAICIQLARKITREIVRATHEFEERLTWNTPYIAVGAITLLSLDLFEMCAMRSNAQDMKDKRGLDYDHNASSRSESHRLWKRAKRCVHQTYTSDIHENIRSKPSGNEKVDIGSPTEARDPSEICTDEAIEQKMEVRRQELIQGLAALEKLSSWSPIAGRGVTLVRSFLNQKEPLPTLINPEINRLDYESSFPRPPTFAKMTDSLTAPTTKVVALNDLKQAEKSRIGEINQASPDLRSLADLEIRLYRKRELELINHSPTHVPPVLPPGVKSFHSVPLDQVSPSRSLPQAVGTHNHFSPPYQPVFTKPKRSFETLEIDLNLSPKTCEKKHQELPPQLLFPRLTSPPPKYSHPTPQVYPRAPEGTFVHTHLPSNQLQNTSTIFDEEMDPRSPTSWSLKTTETQTRTEPPCFPISLSPPTSFPVTTADVTGGHGNLNYLEYSQSTPSGGRNKSEPSVAYDYIDSLLYSSFGLYAAPIDFDALFELPS